MYACNFNSEEEDRLSKEWYKLSVRERHDINTMVKRLQRIFSNDTTVKNARDWESLCQKMALEKTTIIGERSDNVWKELRRLLNKKYGNVGSRSTDSKNNKKRIAKIDRAKLLQRKRRKRPGYRRR